MVKVQRLFAKTNLKIRVCEAMKAPVGLLSGSAVCDSRWRGVAPTSTPQQEHFGNSQELEKRSPGWPLLHPETRTIDFGRWFFCFAGALRDGVVYSAWFNNSEFIKENIDETIFMFALFKCRKSDKGRN